MAREKRIVQTFSIKKKTRRTKAELEIGLTLEQKKKGITVEDIQAQNAQIIVEEKSQKAQFHSGGKAIYAVKGKYYGTIFDIIDVYGRDSEDVGPSMLILRNINNPEKTFDGVANNYKPYNE